MKRLVPALILLILLPYFGPLADPGCPVHGAGCVHGSSCPAAKRQQAFQKGAICHTGEGSGEHEEVKKYRCSISSCHGEEAGIFGLDMPFIVSLPFFIEAQAAGKPFFHEPQKNAYISFDGLLEPPESLSFS